MNRVTAGLTASGVLLWVLLLVPSGPLTARQSAPPTRAVARTVVTPAPPRVTAEERRRVSALLLLLANGGSGGGGGAAPAFVRELGTTQFSESENTSAVITLGAGGVTAGNSVLLFVSFAGQAGTVSATDTAGNTYTVAANSATTGRRVVVLCAADVSALNSGNTITVTVPATFFGAVTAAEFSGLTSGTADVTATNSGSAATALSSLQVGATDTAAELVVAAFYALGPDTDSFTPGAGYTALADVSSYVEGAGGGTLTPVYKITSGTGTQAATATLGNARDYAAAIATFR